MKYEIYKTPGIPVYSFIDQCVPAEKQSEETLFKARELFPEPPRPEGQSDVIELRCDPIDTVRVAFISTPPAR